MSEKRAANWETFAPPAIQRDTPDTDFIPYAQAVIEDDDIAAVTSTLRGDVLTCGPSIGAFETALSSVTGAADSVVCSSGTAALYIATKALGLGRGDTIVVPAITFAATASAPHLAGADIVFADVDPATGLMRASDLEAALARCPYGFADAVIPVHYAGQPCDMEAIFALARDRGMMIIEDAAHALGSACTNASGAILPVGSNAYSDLTIFSFHPAKTIAMGEGGAVTATEPELARRLRRFRNHGVVREDFANPGDGIDTTGAANPWYYEIAEPGFNFRVSDIHCALALSQLKKLSRFVEARRRLVACYDEFLAPLAPVVRPIIREARGLTAWHIYPVRVHFAATRRERGPVMRALAAEGIGTQVHYIPLYRHPYYAGRYGVQSLPGAEAYYGASLTLPLHVGMSEADVARVTKALKRVLGI